LPKKQGFQPVLFFQKQTTQHIFEAILPPCVVNCNHKKKNLYALNFIALFSIKQLSVSLDNVCESYIENEKQKKNPKKGTLFSNFFIPVFILHVTLTHIS